MHLYRSAPVQFWRTFPGTGTFWRTNAPKRAGAPKRAPYRARAPQRAIKRARARQWSYNALISVLSHFYTPVVCWGRGAGKHSIWHKKTRTGGGTGGGNRGRFLLFIELL